MNLINEKWGAIMLVLMFFMQILFFLKVMRDKKILDGKNIQLIQFHLDTKFLCKTLIESLCTSDSLQFCRSLTNQIKDYYNLEDIVVIDSLSMLDGENNTRMRSDIVEFVKDNMLNIDVVLQDHKLTKVVAGNGNDEYILYISRLMAKDEGDGMIICVERSPSLLNENEKASLENCINLLKTRIIYE